MLACAGISAGRRSLHSDVKGSTQRLPVSMVNYEISLWAAEPRETLGPVLMWDQLECLSDRSTAAGAFIALAELV